MKTSLISFHRAFTRFLTRNKCNVPIRDFNVKDAKRNSLNSNIRNNCRWLSTATDSDSNSEEKTQSSEKVKFSFTILPSNEYIELEGKTGQSVMEVAVDSDIGMEGACGGVLSCTTCHVFVDETFLERLPEPDYKEEDLLDNATFLRTNSRLSCQVFLNKDLDGAHFTLPPGTPNMAVDGYKPHKH